MKPSTTFLKIFILACIALINIQSSSLKHTYISSNEPADEYVCTTCGQDCDNTVYNEPGNCPNCKMPLVKKSTVNIKNIQPSEICDYIAKHPEVVLLDVRTKAEFEGTVSPDYGTLKNAINVPIQDLKSRLPEIENLKNKEIIVYCSHSHRSPAATYLLMQNGFTNVTNMAGGMSVMKDNPCKRSGSASKDQQTSSPFSSAVERQLISIERSILFLAEAMPEDKFYFTPESLTIKGSDFKDVRSFAGQVKHLATDNFAIWSPAAGVPLRSDITDVNGPATINTKADIIQYLKESFALGHKAIEATNAENAMDMLDFRGSKLPRLDLDFYALTHDNDHYGQMVVYLRMCGISPQTGKPSSN